MQARGCGDFLEQNKKVGNDSDIHSEEVVTHLERSHYDKQW